MSLLFVMLVTVAANQTQAPTSQAIVPSKRAQIRAQIGALGLLGALDAGGAIEKVVRRGESVDLAEPMAGTAASPAPAQVAPASRGDVVGTAVSPK